MILTAHLERWPLIKPFRISRTSYEYSDVLVVEVEEDGFIGRGEAGGVDDRGDTPEAMLADAMQVLPSFTALPRREDLLTSVAPGGFRNALDCALWDLEAKRSAKRVWELAGLSEPKPLRTFITLGIDTPAAMAEEAAQLPPDALIKLKLGDRDDIQRLQAVRQAQPIATIIVDANEAWTFDDLRALLPAMIDLEIRLIEQPLPSESDEALRGFESPIPICADESCQTRQSLPDLEGKYTFVNIKLDKTGGLTEAIDLATEARKRGFRLMVGCMQATSLGIAPGFLIAQICEIVDLDWHILNKVDRIHGFCSENILKFPKLLWG